MNRKSKKGMPPLLYMPSMADEDCIGWLADKFYKGDRHSAAAFFYILKHEFYNAKGDTSKCRICFDHKSQMWHGRKAAPKRQSLGLPREGRTPGLDLRDKLEPVLGTGHYGKAELLARIQAGLNCSDSEALSKFKQAHYKKIIKYDEPSATWRYCKNLVPLSQTPGFVPDEASSPVRLDHYRKIYGDMPRLRHKVGEEYDPATSQVLAYICEVSGNSDLEWAESEFARIRRYNGRVMFHDTTGEWIGRNVYDLENSEKPAAIKTAKGLGLVENKLVTEARESLRKDLEKDPIPDTFELCLAVTDMPDIPTAAWLLRKYFDKCVNMPKLIATEGDVSEKQNAWFVKTMPELRIITDTKFLESVLRNLSDFSENEYGMIVGALPSEFSDRDGYYYAIEKGQAKYWLAGVAKLGIDKKGNHRMLGCPMLRS